MPSTSPPPSPAAPRSSGFGRPSVLASSVHGVALATPPAGRWQLGHRRASGASARALDIRHSQVQVHGELSTTDHHAPLAQKRLWLLYPHVLISISWTSLSFLPVVTAFSLTLIGAKVFPLYLATYDGSPLFLLSFALISLHSHHHSGVCASVGRGRDGGV